MRGGAGDWQPPPPPVYSTGGRKKGGSGPKRPWLVLYSSGQTPTMENEKNIIMQRTGIRPSDLRILDPLLSYPSTILSREKAIVVNLEHIKAIITAEEVFLLNPKDPSVSPFVHKLQKRIMCHYQEDANTSGQYGPLALKFFKGPYGSDMKVLPFEFVALEACIECATTSLEHEVLRLELEAYPALDKLTTKISTLSLEQVRHIKTRLVAITGRVQRVKDELRNILHDDEDMAEMYLSRKKLAHKFDENSPSCSMNCESDDIVLEGDEDDKVLPEITCEEANRENRVTHTSLSSVLSNYKSNVKELELILEVQFVKMDSALIKLKTLKVEVDDTEKYIKIMQDVKQNEVLQMSVKLSTASLVMNAFIVVAGIFGMNIGIELFNDDKAGPRRFIWTVFGGSLGSMLFYFGVIGWCKFKRLL